MEHQKSPIVIYISSEYSRFGMITGNRKLNDDKIKRIIKEITTGNDMLKYYPIQVRERGATLDIIDGQHRFYICRKLAVPVHYILVKEDKSLPDIAKINSNVDKWKGVDFINCYTKQGNKHYTQLEEFMATYKLALSVSLKLLDCGAPGTEGSNDDLAAKFRYGTFQVKELAKASEIAELLELFAPFESRRQRSFVIAIHRIKQSGLITIAEIAAAYKKRPEMLTEQGNFKNYIYALEQIVNVGKQKRIVIVAAAPTKPPKPEKPAVKKKKPEPVVTTRKQISYEKLNKERKVYKTRVQDNSGKIAVKIDHKTTIYVAPGTDIAALKKKYANNKKL